MPAPSADTMRRLLPETKEDQVLVLNPAAPPIATVLYFPGCGSERLYASIGEAAIYLLLKQNVRIILTPSFLCCGYPHTANADSKKRERLNLRNTILFSQIRDMFSYIKFDACVVTCGTCKEQLLTQHLTDTFEAPVMDATGFLAQTGFHLPHVASAFSLYHAPCHDSLDGKAMSTLKQIGKYDLSPTAHCCSESGTLAISRPDISGTLRDKKSETLSGERVLTNCPSCVQGLRRHVGTDVRHLTEELAIQLGGPAWQNELPSLLTHTEVITF
jgi:Fe-S oxidoreductase